MVRSGASPKYFRLDGRCGVSTQKSREWNGCSLPCWPHLTGLGATSTIISLCMEGPRYKNLGSFFMRRSDTNVTDNGAGRGYASFADVPRCQSEGEARPPVTSWRLCRLCSPLANEPRGGLGCGPASPCTPPVRLLCKMDAVRGDGQRADERDRAQNNEARRPCRERGIRASHIAGRPR